MTEQPQPTPQPPAPDRWSLWFFRLVQVSGLGIVIEQLIVGQGQDERPWILLAGMSMMLGAAGLELGSKALARLRGGRE